MKLLSDRLLRRLENEERLGVLQNLQSLNQEVYPFLASPRLFIRQYRKWLERAGMVLISLIVAAVTMLANFFIFVKILHLEP